MIFHLCSKSKSYFFTWSCFVISFVCLIGRTRHSIGRFPADPGYDYVYSGTTKGIRSWFDLDPYVHFGAHFLSWLASLAPIENHALLLGFVVHFVWSLLAVAIFVVFERENFSRPVSLLSALSLSLCPAAAESSLANVGNIKWPLLIFGLILVSSNQLTRSPKLSASYLFLTGITNPLSVILLFPLLMNYFGCTKQSRKLFLLPILGLLISFVIQAFTVGASGLSHGSGGVKVFTPWPGMGMFWWFGLVSPTILCLGALLLRLFFQLTFDSQLITRVSLAVPVLAFVSYIYGGIGDRYFVAPMVLSWMVSTVFIATFGMRFTRIQFLAISVAALLLFLIPTIKWFNSSWYLRAGSTWNEEVKNAKLECESGFYSVHMNIGEISSIELPCIYIKRN